MLDDIIVWWHPERDGTAPTFDVMPNASNTDRVVAAVGGVETTHGPCRARRPGSERRRAVGRRVSRRRRDRSLPGRVRRLEGRRVHRRRAPATPASGGSRSRSPSTSPPTCGRPSSGPASSRPVSVLATHSASRPRSRCTATSSVPASRRCRPGSAGSSRGSKDRFRGRDALAAERDRGISRQLVGIATEGRRPPRAECAIVIDGETVGAVTSGNFSPTLGHGIALGFVPPQVESRHRRRHRRPRHAAAGTVVDTPFVTAPKPN